MGIDAIPRLYRYFCFGMRGIGSALGETHNLLICLWKGILIMAPLRTSGTGSADAIAMLKDDHKKVAQLFEQFDQLNDADVVKKTVIVGQICTELKVHAQLEEEIFYPAAREAIDEEDLIDEAEAEHADAKELIAQLESLEPDDDEYDRKVQLLNEEIDHHVKEEEGELFPKVIEAQVDTTDLGQQMMQRKEELKAEIGEPDAPGEDLQPPAARPGGRKDSLSKGVSSSGGKGRGGSR